MGELATVIGSAAQSDTLVTALWFAFAIGLMDRFDITLPRGDSIGVSGALVVAGVMVAGLLPISVLSLGVLLLAHVGRDSLHSARLRGAVLARLVALGALWALSPLQGAASGGHLTLPWLVGLPAIYLLAEIIGAQTYNAVQTGRPLRRLLAGNIRRQAPLAAAQLSASVLAAITYPDMQAWSLVLVVALLLLMRQSLALLLEIRETYRTTVEVLVEAAEGQDHRRRGHGERTAKIARSIAERIGLGAADVERVSYAALLHDVDAISDDPAGQSFGSVGQSAMVFRDTAFFDDVLPALRVCDGCATASDATESNLMTAMLVALSSDIDANLNPSAAEAHGRDSVGRVSRVVPLGLKAKVVAGALELGYEIPAVP